MNPLRAAVGLMVPAGLDSIRSTINPLWSSRLRGRIVARRDVGDRSVALTIRPNRRWSGHTPGQWVNVGVEINGVRHHRCYSLTSLPSDSGGTIEIAVRAMPGGLVSNHIVDHCEVGEIVQLDPPSGDFIVRDPAKPMLFIAGGSGLTPVLGIGRSLAGSPNLDATILHFVPSDQNPFLAEDLDSLAVGANGFVACRIVTRGAVPTHLSAELLDAECPDWRSRDAYVCGPTSLIDAATDLWFDAGVIDQLTVERFAPLESIADPTGATHHVRFANSGIDVNVPSGTTLLAVAEAAGLVPPTGCRNGVCHTCSTPLESGSVKHGVDGRTLNGGESVQLCVCTPLTDVVVNL